VFTPSRLGRRSLPLRANVRVGPPAMSSSARSFSPTAFLQLKKPSFNQVHHRGRPMGRFFERKRRKKPHRMVGQSGLLINCTNQ